MKKPDGGRKIAEQGGGEWLVNSFYGGRHHSWTRVFGHVHAAAGLFIPPDLFTMKCASDFLKMCNSSLLHHQYSKFIRTRTD